MNRLIALAALLLLSVALPAAESEGRGHMHDVLWKLNLPFSDATWTITGWKILGFLGLFMFGARWLLQAWHRKRTGLKEIPTMFWVVSLVGAGMVTMYFVWGKNDSVGILSNALPASVALYNLILDLKLRRARLASGAPPLRS